jgi:hypothetical protein
MFGTIIVLAVFGLIVGVIAKGKGRSFAPWFLYGALLFIVAIIHVLVLSDDKKKQKQCEECFKLIDVRATKCPYCQAKQQKKVEDILQERQAKEDEKHKHDTRNIIIVIILVILAAVLFNYGITGHF